MRNVLDRVVGYFDPAAGLKRIQSRAAMNAVERNYNLADKGRRGGGWIGGKTTAGQEVSKGMNDMASAGQELCRNNPIALRAKRVWSASVVGSGIKLEINSPKSKTAKSVAKKLNNDWDDWAESVYCDFDGRQSFYGLQWMWMNTIVESGGVLIRKHLNAALLHPLQLQCFEQTSLDRSKSSVGADENVQIIDGIQFKGGVVDGYWIKSEPTQIEKAVIAHSEFYKAENIIHIFLADRFGQHLGVSWFQATGNAMKNYDTYQDAKLMQQQIAACFALFMEGSPTAVGLNDGDVDGTLDRPDELQPGIIEYVEPGTKPFTVSPPKADNSSAFDISLKRDMAVGIGLTYEQITGDYSLVNFASGRMGKTEFHSQLDIIQHIMLKPQLNRVFEWFKGMDSLKRKIKGQRGLSELKLEWSFPVRAAVDPKAEFEVLMAKVRHGMLSPQKAAKMLGERLDVVVSSWEEAVKLFGDLPFDIDPSKFSPSGNQLNSDDAASSNAESKTKSDSAKQKDKEGKDVK